MASESKRIVFTFDPSSYSVLERIAGDGRSKAEAVRESLVVNGALRHQAELGFTEVVVRNPKTREQRVIVMPNLAPSRDPS